MQNMKFGHNYAVTSHACLGWYPSTITFCNWWWHRGCTAATLSRYFILRCTD